MSFDLKQGLSQNSAAWLVKPPRQEYEKWLERVWRGDLRELRRGRYLQQQRDLLEAFRGSDFFRNLCQGLRVWASQYEAEAGVQLFSGSPSLADLQLKPWESFLSRTWRENVHNNKNWPEPPADGWRAPDCWYELLSDVVRTRIEVRYLDGVQFIADRLTELGSELSLAVEQKSHAQEWGYYAMHVNVPQVFEVQTLNYVGQGDRSSKIEIQLTTQLKEAVGHLTHGFFEKRREEEAPADSKWQWDYDSLEFTPYYLGHLVHYLEGMIMQVRDKVSNPEGL